MSKFLKTAVCTAAVLAMTAGFAMAADYPPCKSKGDDKCVQMPGGGPHAATPMKKHKTMHKKTKKKGAEAPAEKKGE